MSFFGFVLLGALLSSLPIGPINLTLMSLVSAKKKSKWWMMVAGVIAADILAGVLTLAAVRENPYVKIDTITLSDHQKMISYMIFGGIFVLIGLGMIYSALRLKTDKVEIKVGSLYFWAGFAGTIFEPTLGVFWLAWWIKGIEYIPVSLVESWIFLPIGIAIGDLAIFGALRKLTERFSRDVSLPFLTKIQCAIGGVLAAAGLFFVVKSLL